MRHFSVVVPSFMVSELKTAFQIGFLIFYSVSSHRPGGIQRADVDGHDDVVTDAHARWPFKIMLFVLVDGWSLVLGTLAASFYV